MKPAGAQQHQIIEVSASARPSEVVAAVIAGAQQPRSPALNHNRWIQMTFAFCIVFAIIVYFREEIYTLGRDVRKHPIMGYVEQVQVQHYLGSGWLFGSGNDVTAEDAEVAEALLAASNSTVAGPVVIQQ